MKYQARLVNERTGTTEAGCSGPDFERTKREIMHYLMVYSQDEPYRAEIKSQGGRWKKVEVDDD